MSKSKLVVGIVVALGALWSSGCATQESSRRAFTQRALAEWNMREAHLVRLQQILRAPTEQLVEHTTPQGAEMTFTDETFAGSW